MSKKENDKILYGQDIQKYCQELLDKEIQALNEEDLSHRWCMGAVRGQEIHEEDFERKQVRRTTATKQ